MSSAHCERDKHTLHMTYGSWFSESDAYERRILRPAFEEFTSNDRQGLGTPQMTVTAGFRGCSRAKHATLYM